MRNIFHIETDACFLQLCVDYMVEKMSVNTASEAMQAGVTYGQDRLQKAAMAYIESNTQVTDVGHYRAEFIFRNMKIFLHFYHFPTRRW